jgi:hypothetical protein
MEDNLNILVNGRRPQNSARMPLEDEINFLLGKATPACPELDTAQPQLVYFSFSASYFSFRRGCPMVLKFCTEF